MEILQQSGLVSLYDYQQLDSLEIYRCLESSSERFLRTHSDLLKSYSRGWVSDPFHQWSRRWEYPWVAAKLLQKNVLNKGAVIREPLRVLDVGSGLTFFPFFLADENPRIEIHALDSDHSLKKAYESIQHPRVTFSFGELQSLPYEDASFDALYCISVLEHIGIERSEDFDKIATEFRRVLKPGGEALVTFDICLNGLAEISPSKAEHLFRAFSQRFRMEDSNAIEFTDLRRPSGLVRTEWIRKHKPSALPWRYPKLSAFKAGLLHGRWPQVPDLTFCTLAMVHDKKEPGTF